MIFCHSCTIIENNNKFRAFNFKIKLNRTKDDTNINNFRSNAHVFKNRDAKVFILREN